MFKRKYAEATADGTHIVIPIIKAGEVNFAVGADWTPVNGDVKVTKDDGTPANIATLPTYVANQGWEFQLSAAEQTCLKLDVLIVDSATKAIEDQFFTVNNSLLGYVEGFVYYNAAASNTNTLIGRDGTQDNPVSSPAAAIALANKLGKKIRIRGAFALAVDVTGYVIEAWDGSPVITGSAAVDITDVVLTGIEFTGFMIANNKTTFHNCRINIITGSATQGLAGYLYDCHYKGNIDLSEVAGAETHINGGHGDPINPTFDFANLNNQHQLIVNGFHGHFHVDNMIHANAWTYVSSNNDTDIHLSTSCTGGQFTGVGRGTLDFGANVGATIDILQWEDIHSTPEIGKLSNVDDASNMTLDSHASVVVDVYNNDWALMITKGTGAGQVRQITDYTALRVVTVSPAFTILPDTTSLYHIIPWSASSGSLTDWTDAEKNQIRHRMNIDGTQTAPSVEGGGAGKIAGPNADLTLKSMNVIQTTNDEDAVRFIGKVSGAGFKTTGGISGHGMHSAGGASIGHGIFAEASGGGGSGEDANALHLEKNNASVGSALRAIVTVATGPAIKATGSGNSEGVLIEGAGTGDGIKAIGGATSGTGFSAVGGGTGHGIHAESGTGATGNGFVAEAKSTNGDGLKIIGIGTGHGLHSTGGSSGRGATFTGGSAGGITITAGSAGHGLEIIAGANPSMDGIRITAGTTGHGMNLLGKGTGFHGLYAKGGSGGATGDGVRFESLATNGNGLMTVKTGTGIDLHASDHGDGSWEGGGALVLQSTTIANLVSQVEFDLVAGSGDNGAYDGCIAVIEDASTATQKAVGIVMSYIGASKTIKLLLDPGVFTMANTDKIDIISAKQLVLQQTLDGTPQGEVDATIAPTATVIYIDTLTNIGGVDLTVADIYKNRTLTFRSGACQGQQVAIQAQAVIAAGVIKLTTTAIAGFAGIAANDRVEII